MELSITFYFFEQNKIHFSKDNAEYKVKTNEKNQNKAEERKLMEVST